MLLEYQPALGAIFFTEQTLSPCPYPTSIYSILSCIFDIQIQHRLPSTCGAMFKKAWKSNSCQILITSWCFSCFPTSILFQVLCTLTGPQVAIHFNVASLFLPTETFFDDVSWWSGQYMYNVVASYYFPQQWIQINSIYCENKEHRDDPPQTDFSAAAPVKSYNRICAFERPLVWMISSFKLLDIKLKLLF